MKKVIALQEYTDQYVSIYEGQIRNIDKGLVDKLIKQNIVAEYSDDDSSRNKYVLSLDELPDTGAERIVYLINGYEVQLYYNGWASVSLFGLTKIKIVDIFPNTPASDTAYLIINGDEVTAGAINPLTGDFNQKTSIINYKTPDPEPLDFFVYYYPKIYMWNGQKFYNFEENHTINV